MLQRLDQISMYRKQVKNRNMYTTFWKITKDLVDSDTDFHMLKIFNVHDINPVMQHLISFIGCEPFIKEIKKIKGDIEKYSQF